MKVDVRYSVFLTLDLPEEELTKASTLDRFSEQENALNALILNADPLIKEFMEKYDNELSAVTGHYDGWMYYEA